ncbi:MAG: bifunctional DNA-formamidopyrimidine glycosylase/DNA-(apurinic or apyrimidinic site) lyase [Bdellovibrionaceae bacterium]|nr:bifunctional DNA-formamidopyrimidine glycosylase/DNA-(apurinic or apyrimidinic site) lyase [Pseudobdellovibrionaceae bacterium]
MPELPEVETVRRGLEDALRSGSKITRFEFNRKDLRDPMPIRKIQTLVGEAITHVERRAKYLVLRTPKGSLLSHLGMTGTWREAKPGDERLHDHIYIHFENGLRLAYRDPRRFGIFDFIKVGEDDEHPKLKFLGYEPLTEAFTGESLWAALRGKAVAIKVAIMDQKIVVGVGNIYASEALFKAGIRPATTSLKVSRERSAKLVVSIKEILHASIAAGGSSISDYENVSGESGYFQKRFSVYDRENLECLACGKKIRAQILGGRSTFWCSTCQK